MLCNLYFVFSRVDKKMNLLTLVVIRQHACPMKISLSYQALQYKLFLAPRRHVSS